MENQVKLSVFVQKVFIWRYDCSYDVYLIKISPDLTREAAAEVAFVQLQNYKLEALEMCISNIFH